MNGAEKARNVYGRNLIARESDGEKAIYRYNGHGDVIALNAPNGDMIAEYAYDEFGQVIEEQAAPQATPMVDIDFSVEGSEEYDFPEDSIFDNPYRYAGYEYLDEVELYDLNARYYDPSIARFLTEDPYYNLGNRVMGVYEINVPNVYSIMQANALYAYCGNNPINFKDLTGLEIVWIRAWVESRNGKVNPVKYGWGIFSFGLKQIDVTLDGKTKTYTSSDYEIKDGYAYIDDEQLYSDFGTTGVGSAKPYVEVASVIFENGAVYVVNNINCYAFAIGMESNAQPGWASGKKIDYSKPYSVETVASYVISDLNALGRSGRIIDGVDGKILSNERRIAVRVGTKPIKDNDGNTFYDYHFMVQNSDGTWSEKHGSFQTSIHHESGNPDNIAWTLGDEEYYDSEIIYMALTD